MPRVGRNGIEQWFSTGGDFAPLPPVITTEGERTVGLQWVEARDATTHRSVPRTAPRHKV